MRFDGSPLAVRNHDVPCCSSFGKTQHGRAGDARSLFDRDDMPRRSSVPFPITRVSIGSCRIAEIAVASIQEPGNFKDQPGCKLRAIPRASPVWVVLRDQNAENVFVSDVRESQLQNLLSGCLGNCSAWCSHRLIPPKSFERFEKFSRAQKLPEIGS